MNTACVQNPENNLLRHGCRCNQGFSLSFANSKTQSKKTSMDAGFLANLAQILLSLSLSLS
jgi:hypothetical protein